MTSFLDSFSNNRALYEKLEKILKVTTVAKGTVLQRKGDILTKVYFVKRGCLRSYTIDEKGKEHIFMFAPEGWIMADIESEVKNAPAELYVDAIEQTEIEIYSKSNIDKILLSKQMITEIGSEKLLKRISVLQQRIIMLMSASAFERYEDFIKTYPNIVQRVPQKMIASYLGITPQALSTIRRVKTKRKSAPNKLM